MSYYTTPRLVPGLRRRGQSPELQRRGLMQGEYTPGDAAREARRRRGGGKGCRGRIPAAGRGASASAPAAA